MTDRRAPVCTVVRSGGKFLSILKVKPEFGVLRTTACGCTFRDGTRALARGHVGIKREFMLHKDFRSETRSVGKDSVSSCRFRGSPYHSTNKKNKYHQQR